jgi:hypothetical protein
MRPAILIAVLVVVAIAAAVALKYGARRLDGVVASTVERYGSAITGTDVSVDGVNLALTAGRAELAGVTIDNPRGYETDYAVHVGRASVELDVASLAGDVPVIEEIVLDGALVNAEQRDAASNLTDIQRHATASSGEEPAQEPARIVVERFRVNDARVLLTSEYLKEPEELPLSDVVVEGIGSGTGGATYSEAASAMLMPVLAAARTAAAARLREVAGEAVSQAAREELEGESEELRERTDEARQRISERAEELLDRE